MEHNFIAVEGNIGVGKTTLAGALSERLDAQLMLEEFEHNSFLPLFYKEPERYAFSLELSFLADRYEQFRRIFSQPSLFSSRVVSDYIFQKTLLFARNNLSEQEYHLYDRIASALVGNMPNPDVIIYLHASPEYLKEQILRRGRSFEREISLQYLSELEERYFAFMKQNNSLKFMVIDRERHGLDFHRKEDVGVVMEYLSKSLIHQGMNIYQG